jgi:light-regulated signal transduction histidine kinase (bacteriophytochrome)
MDNILKERQLIDKIYTSAKRMESLIESIGKYSTISLTDIDEPPVIVNEVINEVLEDLEEVIRSKNAIVQMPELHAIPVNRIHLYQLFQNLFTNAIKYSKEKIQPVISISSEETADNFILFRFSDNGIGFPVEYAEKVFLPFQRLHGNKYSGIGIGLSICKKIIEVYGGTISVESIPDDGSTFIFTLPAKK